MKRKFTLNSLCCAFLIGLLACCSTSYAQVTYCTPTFNNQCLAGGGNYINNVVLTNLNASMSTCSQQDYTSDTAYVSAGVAEPMQVTVNGFDGIGVFVDLNGDGNFNDTDEFFYTQLPSAQPSTYNFTITLPNTLIPGFYRMRILTAYNATFAIGDACDSFQNFGSYADLTLGVTDSSCFYFTQAVLQTSKICPGTTDTLHASVVDTSAGLDTVYYQWQYNSVDIPGATDTNYVLNNFSTSDTGAYRLVARSHCGLAATTFYIKANPAPNAAITAISATALCPGDTIRLMGVSDSTGTVYQWMRNGNNINNGGTGDTITRVMKNSTAGDYQVAITNICGTATSNPVTITMKAAPTVSIAPQGPTTFCPGDSLKLKAVATNGSTYQWMRNGLNLYMQTDSSYIARSAGSYVLVATNPVTTCSTTSAALAVSNYPAPTVTITPSSTVKLCIGGTQVFMASYNDSDTYQWKKNGAAITGATDTQYTASTSGLYAVTATNTFGCKTTTSNTDLIISTPATVNIAVTGSNLICQGSSKQLSAISADTASEFQWQLNGVDIQGATNSTYMASQAGSYSVIDFNGCTSTSGAISLATNAFPTVVAAGPTTFCEGGNVTLNSSVTTMGNGIHYQWLKDGSPISGATSTSYNANAAGTYLVVIVSDSNCTATSTTATVMVNANPHPTILADPNSYNLYTDGTYDTYQWEYQNAPITGATNYMYTVTQNGLYQVVVTDDNGCMGISGNYSETRFTPPPPNTAVPTVTVAKDAIKVYPNPASTTVYIDAPVKVNVTVLSIDGKEVMTTTNATSLDITRLAAGTYMLRITDANGNYIKTDKLVKTGVN